MNYRTKVSSFILAASMLASTAAPALAAEPSSVKVNSTTIVDGMVTQTTYDGDEVVTEIFTMAPAEPEVSPKPSSDSTPAPEASHDVTAEPESTHFPDIQEMQDKIIESAISDINKSLYDSFLFKLIKQYVIQCIEEYFESAEVSNQ